MARPPGVALSVWLGVMATRVPFALIENRLMSLVPMLATNAEVWLGSITTDVAPALAGNGEPLIEERLPLLILDRYPKISAPPWAATYSEVVPAVEDPQPVQKFSEAATTTIVAIHLGRKSSPEPPGLAPTRAWSILGQRTLTGSLGEVRPLGSS